MSEAPGYFVKYRARISGPFSAEEIAAMIRNGALTPIHRVSTDRQQWRALHETEGWRHLWNPAAQASTAPTQGAQPAASPATPAPKPPQNDREEPADVELLE